MRTRIITDVTLSANELMRLGSWYRSHVADKHAITTPEDIVLDAKLNMIRVDLENRHVVRSEAVRTRSDVQRHVGVERRTRVPLISHRIIRPVVKVTN